MRPEEQLKIVMLTTEKATKLYQSNLSETLGILKQIRKRDGHPNNYDCSPSFNLPLDQITPKHLHITSREDIKKGEWFVFDSEKIVRAENDINVHDNMTHRLIVASTDMNMMPMAWIRESFMSAYIKEREKGNIIKKVSLEMEEKWDEDTSKDYIPGKGQPCVRWWELKTRPDGSVRFLQNKIYDVNDVKRFAWLAVQEAGEMEDKSKLGLVFRDNINKFLDIEMAKETTASHISKG